MSMWKTGILVVAAAAMSACATVPKPLAGTYNDASPSSAQKGATQGTQVRWGGRIIKTEPEQQQTCFFMLSVPLDSAARPRENAPGEGRFVACKNGFYDPEVFSPGREVTFTGTLDGSMTRKVGKYDYTYPKLDVSVVYLWPKRIQVRQPYWGPSYYPYDPFWGPTYDPFWGPYPYWYSPRVILVHPVQKK